MGLWERKGKGSIDNLSVLLTVENEWIDRLTINIVHSTIQNGTLEYNNYLLKFEHIVQVLGQMIPIQSKRPLKSEPLGCLKNFGPANPNEV